MSYDELMEAGCPYPMGTLVEIDAADVPEHHRPYRFPRKGRLDGRLRGYATYFDDEDGTRFFVSTARGEIWTTHVTPVNLEERELERLLLGS